MTLNNKKVVAIVLGGGRGTRLYPLTMDRSKPAVPFAGKYRLVDIPISNCINSNIRQIYVLTQFNSASLHNHIASTYNFDAFSGGFVEILAAEQTYTSETWYQGTADAVRKNLKHFRDQNADYYVILSGDQLYRMDFNKMLQRHIESKAVLTIAGKPISRPEATGLGIMGCDEKGMITKFFEKPSPDADITDYIVPESTLRDQLGVKRNEKNEYIASMGIYIFNAQEMEQALNNDKTDFGKEIIPDIIKSKPVSSYLFDGYWEDIGTVKAFYEANLNLASDKPSFNFYDEEMPIYTHRRHLPATKANFCSLSNALASEGSIITNATIVNSIVGVRTFIEAGASLDGVYCMGASRYESEEEKATNAKNGIPNIGIGRATIIKRAEGDFEMYSVHDGIIVINKNAIIPDGTVI